MYIADHSSGKILKVDLSAATPTAVDYITDVNFPLDLKLVGNDLYYRSFSHGALYKVDITAATPSPVVFANALVYGHAVYGNQIYFTSSSDVKKITLNSSNSTTVYSGLTHGAGLFFIGSELYIADLLDNKIIMIDVSVATPIATDIVTGLTNPNGINFDGKDIYIAEYGGGKITKYNLFTVSTDNVLGNPDWTLFPNPATASINFKGLEEQQPYEIIDALGRTVQTGTATPNQPVSVNELGNGRYFIRLENGEIQQFLKK